ncbi:MAG: hypothetical protein IMZ46_13945 [Acidobacteria bacterium]|nr:hypothetical protein [Acidobacteriota bacterium]
MTSSIPACPIITLSDGGAGAPGNNTPPASPLVRPRSLSETPFLTGGAPFRITVAKGSAALSLAFADESREGRGLPRDWERESPPSEKSLSDVFLENRPRLCAVKLNAAPPESSDT